MRLTRVVTLNNQRFRTDYNDLGLIVDFIKAWYPSKKNDSKGKVLDYVEGKPAAFMAFNGDEVITIPYHAVSSYTESIDLTKEELPDINDNDGISMEELNEMIIELFEDDIVSWGQDPKPECQEEANKLRKALEVFKKCKLIKEVQ